MRLTPSYREFCWRKKKKTTKIKGNTTWCSYSFISPFNVENIYGIYFSHINYGYDVSCTWHTTTNRLRTIILDTWIHINIYEYVYCVLCICIWAQIHTHMDIILTINGRKIALAPFKYFFCIMGRFRRKIYFIGRLSAVRPKMLMNVLQFSIYFISATFCSLFFHPSFFRCFGCMFCFCFSFLKVFSY